MRIGSIIIIIVALLLAWNSMFDVNEGQSALVLQFGHIERTDTAPGLHFKWPFLQQALHFDMRIQNLDSPPERYFTEEKKSVNIDFYVKWRITDDSTFYRATSGDKVEAVQRLKPIVKDALRFQINSRPLDALISGGRSDITSNVRKQADASTRKNLGVSIVDVRIKRIDLPEAVSDSVYKRMRAERKKLANKLRSTGNEEAEKIRADADRQRQVLVADAHRDAAKVRGEGDAKAADIYARAYSQDARFFRFYRSLQAYRSAFGSGKNVLILKPDSQLMRYFQDDGNGKH